MHIYALVNKLGEVMYVGGTKRDGHLRLKEHLAAAEAGVTSYLYDWLRSPSAQPQLVILETNPPDGLDDAERRWIADFRSKGAMLCNLTDGGVAGYTHSEESRAKLSKAFTGRRLSQKTRKKLSEIAKHREPASPETRAKISAANKGRKPSPKAIAKAREARLGAVVSAETRAKLSKAQTGKKMSLEAREKISKWGKANSPTRGKTLPVEMRSRISNAVSTAWKRGDFSLNSRDDKGRFVIAVCSR